MVSGIIGEFKIPIGYFFTCGLCAEEKVAILNEAMRKLSETGVKLASMTSDGFTANIAAYKKMGADFEENKPYFLNPYDADNKVYVVLDPPHMIKLVRNCIARFHKKEIILVDSHKNEISFGFIKNLVELQTLMGINLGNKLTKTHAEFENVKMRVRIAVQTISKSSAASIEFLDMVMEHENFANSIGTTQFFRTFDSSFDIMNSKKGHTDDKFKRPICVENIAEITEKFNHDKDYIRGLMVIDDDKTVSVLNTESRIPFFGFYHNMTSMLGIYHDYVAPEFSGIEEFYTFSISQDHVESTFGCIRQKGGNNSNPNEQQFTAAYGRLQLQNEITSSNYSNCVSDVTKILEVSSGTKRVPASADPFELQRLATYQNQISIQTHEVSGLKSHSKAHLASELEKKVNKIIRLRKSKACTQCLNIFVENEKLNDIFIQFLSQMKEISQPCKSTIHVITMVDNILEEYDSQDISYPTMLAFILDQVFSSSPLFESSEFGQEHDHKLDFVKLLIETYIDMKCMNVCRLVTRCAQKILIRQYNLKETHREGQ